MAKQTGGVGSTRSSAKAKSDSAAVPQSSRPPHLSFEVDGNEIEHRGFPRALLQVPVRVWVGDEDSPRFRASLVTINLSVNGSFLESSFFLPQGTEVECSFELSSSETVRARAEVVREQRSEKAKHTGMAVRFLEFFGQSEIAMARLFLGGVLREFSQAFLDSARGRAAPNELERVTDLLAAWELKRITLPGDPWRMGL